MEAPSRQSPLRGSAKAPRVDFDAMSSPANIEAFLQRWTPSGASERSNFQPFAMELCDLLEVPRPEPARPDFGDYHFERQVVFRHGDGSQSFGRVDLYKRGCFVMEAKQGASANAPAPLIQGKPIRVGAGERGSPAWVRAMMGARGQAEQYARALPPEEGRPPFVVVVDVGHCIDLYSEFSRSGGSYVPFPDPREHRIPLAKLREEETRQLLHSLWTNPLALDPTKRAAKVTREIAAQLAELARSLEGAGRPPEVVAHFLMRCIFTMFAEDAFLLPKDGFRRILENLLVSPQHFRPMVQDLWQKMNEGGFSSGLATEVKRFNGGLFANSEALDLNAAQLELLIKAAVRDWREVEPAIFGTLLERALDPQERHRLGAHYTPRAYVERLILPTIVEPLRQEWEQVKTIVFELDKTSKRPEAVQALRDFHNRLCEIRVLDPACGTGNFLYVAMEHLKRIEGEIVTLINELNEQPPTHYIEPKQFLGIEKNKRAAPIADLVLWIGYIQWQLRVFGHVQEPVLQKLNNIERRDAVLDWEGEPRPVIDEKTKLPVSRWDGRTMKTHPATGQPVPDESARVPLLLYVKPRPATWPQADFIVGNPPFVGNWKMRETLGDGYAEALRAAWPEVPKSSDYVVYWWRKAAETVAQGKARRFGLIATNSLSQKNNRQVIQQFLAEKKPVSLIFAIPDHPWVDEANGAAVRVCMTVGEAGRREGVLRRVVHEQPGEEGIEVQLEERQGLLHPNLTIGPNTLAAVPLQANEGLSCPGVKLHGAGFIVTPEEAQQLGLGRVAGLEKHIRPYRNGRDITERPRGVMVIDLFGFKSAEEIAQRFPEVYQWVAERVRPEREAKKGRNQDANQYAEEWWLFGKTRSSFRPALRNLKRYIATVETSKHRFFIFLNIDILPDNKLLNIALENAYFLGILSSRAHVTWALETGAKLGVGNDPVYVKTRCFDPFPFPDPTPQQKARIRQLGERLDAHRKSRLELFPELTMTGLYNVLEKLRAGEELTDKERDIHEKGLVAVLREIHDDLDKAVFDAYGWPADLSDEAILERLVNLNTQRAAEEKTGKIRWLRPDYQCPGAAPAAEQEDFAGDLPAAPALAAAPGKPSPWPKPLVEQVGALRDALAALGQPATAEEIAACFRRAPRAQVASLLETLAYLGQARLVDQGRYAAPQSARQPDLLGARGWARG
jgi:hypothetical protein